MARRPIPLSLKVTLVVLGLAAIVLNSLVFFDLPVFQVGVRGEEESAMEEQWEGVRDSVFLVLLQRCDQQGGTSGTAFVVAPGYLITNAHVVGEAVSCESPVRVVDSLGREQEAMLDSYSDELDLALLKINDIEAPSLPLADSSLYEDSDQVLAVYTVGYPLVGAASMPDRASYSGVGSLSQYERDRELFITSGLNVNPGNSGGPVLFESERRVIGVASAKLDPSVGDDIGYAIPAKKVQDFFFEKTGQELGVHDAAAEE